MAARHACGAAAVAPLQLHRRHDNPRAGALGPAFGSRPRPCLAEGGHGALQLSPGETVSRIQRLRLADDTPMAIEYAVVPSRFLPDPQEVESSLYAVLIRRGFGPRRALQRLHAVLLERGAGGFADLTPGAAALYIERRSFLPAARRWNSPAPITAAMPMTSSSNSIWRRSLMPEVLIPERLFDGEKLLSRHAVVIEGGRIQAVLPANAVDSSAPPASRRAAGAGLRRRPGQWRRRRAVQRRADPRGHPGDRRRPSPLRHHGLPAHLDHRSPGPHGRGDRRGARALAAASPACSASISKGRSSARIARASTIRGFMRPVEPADIAVMTSLRAGRTLVTLAPERVPPEIIGRLPRPA